MLREASESAFRRGFLGFERSEKYTGEEAFFYELGKLIDRFHTIQNEIQNNEVMAFFAFILFLIVVILILFGFVIYHFLVSELIIFGVAAVNLRNLAKSLLSIHDLRRLAQKEWAPTKSAPQGKSSSLAYIFFLEAFKEKASAYASDRLYLQPEHSKYYIIFNSIFWIPVIVFPLYFGTSLLLSYLSGENGWYNYIGINVLGW
jgi:hypothetical protein